MKDISLLVRLRGGDASKGSSWELNIKMSISAGILSINHNTRIK